MSLPGGGDVTNRDAMCLNAEGRNGAGDLSLCRRSVSSNVLCGYQADICIQKKIRAEDVRMLLPSIY